MNPTEPAIYSGSYSGDHVNALLLRRIRILLYTICWTHRKIGLFLKIRAKNLSDIRDIIEKKIRRLPNVLETELMTVLKTSKEEQIVSLKNDISDPNKDEY